MMFRLDNKIAIVTGGGSGIGRMAQPEEVAYLALYLCREKASFITGCDYPIDGGFIHLNN